MSIPEETLLAAWPRYRWTADEAVKDVRLDGKVIIITGATNGIGIPTAIALARTGAKLIITARDAGRGKAALEKIIQASGNSNVEVKAMDLTSFATIRTFAEEFLATKQPLYALVHNAGIMATPFELTPDGYESQLQVNYLSVLLLTKLLLPALSSGQPSRVVAVSSIAHKRAAALPDVLAAINWNEEAKYDKWVAYGVAKSLEIMLMNELNRQFKARGLRITANSLHPGGMLTGLQYNITKEERIAFGWIDAEGNINKAFKTDEQGGSTTAWATVSSELEGRGGLYFENCAISEVATPLDKLQSMAGGTVPFVWNEDVNKAALALTEQRLGLTFF